MARARKLRLTLLSGGVARAAAATAGKLELPDLLLAGGVTAVGAGIAMIYPPAALITVGLLLLAGGLRLAGSRQP